MPEPLPSLRLGEIRDLPTLPSMAATALAVAEDPSSTASDLLRVILTDPPLAARVLRVANSVYFRREGSEITDLQTAIIRLGFSNVRNLLMGVSVIRSFNAFFVDSPYTREDFWVHCISVGALAGRLSRADERLSSSTAFVVGLLHDIGKLVLDRYRRDSFLQALRLAQGERLPLDEAERRRFGTDHAAIAGDLLDLWNFPRELSDPIRWHHDPGQCPERHRMHAMLVHVADFLCDARRLGYSGNDHPVKPPAHYFEALRIREADLEAHLDALREEPLLIALLPA
jgi:HD-like signal output (HDOD) protein